MVTKSDAELLTVEPEVLVSLELQKNNLTDAVLLEWERDYLPLKIEGVEDKEGFALVHSARMNVKNARIMVEKYCKKGRETAIAIQKKWIAKEKEVVEKLSKIEEHLESEESRINDLKKEAREALLRERITRALGAGLQFTGSDYVYSFPDGLGGTQETRLSKEALETMPEDEFETLVGYMEKLEEARKAKIKEEADKRKAEREALEAQRKSQEEKERLFAEREAKLKEAELAIARAEAEAKRQKEAEEALAIQQAKRAEDFSRNKALNEAGFRVSGDNFVAYTISMPWKELSEMSRAEFDAGLEKAIKIIAGERALEAELAEAKRRGAVLMAVGMTYNEETEEFSLLEPGVAELVINMSVLRALPIERFETLVDEVKVVAQDVEVARDVARKRAFEAELKAKFDAEQKAKAEAEAEAERKAKALEARKLKAQPDKVKLDRLLLSLETIIYGAPKDLKTPEARLILEEFLERIEPVKATLAVKLSEL